MTSASTSPKTPNNSPKTIKRKVRITPLHSKKEKDSLPAMINL
jgi:hypothetical protein